MDWPVSSNRFSVTLGMFTMSCARVRNISREIQFDVLKEGGINDYVHVLQKPYTTPHKLIFERGICDSDILSKLTPLLVGKKLPFPGLITVKDYKGDTVASYSFKEPIILRWEIGDLDALENKVLMEKLEVAHSGISVSILGTIAGLLF